MQTAIRRRCRARSDADIVDGQTYNELGGGDIRQRLDVRVIYTFTSAISISADVTRRGQGQL
jgi:hypothetical protein